MLKSNAVITCQHVTSESLCLCQVSESPLFIREVHFSLVLCGMLSAVCVEKDRRGPTDIRYDSGACLSSVLQPLTVNTVLWVKIFILRIVIVMAG